MTGTRTLVFGASWCPDEEKRELCKLWARSMEKVAPDCDILVIDCNSPFRPGSFLRELGYTEIPEDACGAVLPEGSYGRHVWSFSDNVGHLSIGGQDGWGRSFCHGLQIAINSGYDYVVYLEPDVLFAQRVMVVVEKMHRSGVKVACPMDLIYHFIDNEIMFFNVEYLKQVDFIGKYDWENPPPATFEIVPERRCETIIRDDLFILPLRGIRNDFNNITVDNLTTAFPLGMDWLTHCKDFRLYEMFAKWKGMID